VEFREAIANTIPSLNELLDDSDKGVREEIIELVGNLANHGEVAVKSIVAQLTRTTKLNFAKPSEVRFHRSISCLETRTGAFG
jgi:hypothetical protein